MKTLRRFALLAVACALWPGTGGATPNQGWIRGYACNDCSLDQYRDTAITQGAGKHLVYDLQNNQIGYYSVTPARQDGGSRYQATPLQVPLEQQKWFARARATWAMHGQTSQALETAVRIDTSDLTNLAARDQRVGAYDVVKSSFDANNFADTLAEFNASGFGLLAQNVIDLLQAAGGIIMDDNAVQLTTDVTLDNGSKLKFVWKQGGDRPRLAAAYDANNNTIPLQPGDVGVNIYSFESYHPNLQSFVGLMQRYNIPTTVRQGVWIESCVQTGQRGIVCTAGR